MFESHTDRKIESVPQGRKAIRYLLWKPTEVSDVESTLKLIILAVSLKVSTPKNYNQVQVKG